MSHNRPKMPGRKSPDAETSLCPPWCDDQDLPDHWDYIGKVWQTIHACRRGRFTVYVPQEIHDDGEIWVGRCEIHVADDGEFVYYAVEAVEAAEQFAELAKFAVEQDALTVKCARDGIHKTCKSLLQEHDVDDPPTTQTETSQ